MRESKLPGEFETILLLHTQLNEEGVGLFERVSTKDSPSAPARRTHREGSKHYATDR